ncbi:platelet endothelial cell adhesion molecule isoform X3 [Dicentrarchus labrax]|uniref:platelet endothelial cell adhesion molecule isoform X3 n=1 Tax=Dicentrarchus labrax TaxID=13489 RepID=UPI0021F62087|nr:platelet endothelial cell adhesion molecule isoform X3 [Dicentrarchus labrax]
MTILLLLTSTLLSSYFHPWGVVNAQSFTIRNITLSIEPSTDVTRDTNVTLRCQALVSISGQAVLSREYTIYKDSNVVYTKTSSTPEDLLYLLPEARVFNTGKYKCTVKIESREMSSDVKKLTVTGLSKPVLHLNKGVVIEGEEVTARCTAPGETGSIFFYFFKDSKEFQDKHTSSNQAEIKLHFSSVGVHKIHCSYTVLVTPESFKSEDSNNVTVSVKELPITAVLEIGPQYKIYEGDQLDISCSISNLLHNSESFHLYLSQGDSLLSSGNKTTTLKHVMVAKAIDPGEFECKLEIGNIVKVATKILSVTELFSAPTITISPAEVFQREIMKITCRCERYASERLTKEDVTYTLDPPQSSLNPGGNGVFSGRALHFEFNYTCVAEAKGIKKHSEALTVRPKVYVSVPRISVDGRAVLGKPFKILCQSDIGSLPINYTLFKDYKPLSTTSIKLSSQQAIFTVTITKPEEINKFMCEAKNSHREGGLSKNLITAVIEPLSDPTVTVLPSLENLYEGGYLDLLCSIRGTPPVTFKWYREGREQPLSTTTSNQNYTKHNIPLLSKESSGRYYCEAFNHANNVRSDNVDIVVQLAQWKKGVIVGFCLLVVSVLVVLCVLCFRSKRVKADRVAVSVWSKRPSEDDADSDEESSVKSNEPDVEYTEVVHPGPVDPARVPFRKGTDTVYSELQKSPHGAADHHDYGSVEYADLNGEQPEINHYHPEVNNYQDLPVPVD